MNEYLSGNLIETIGELGYFTIKNYGIPALLGIYIGLQLGRVTNREISL